VFVKERHSQILVNLPITNVPRCTSNNARTLGLKNLQLPNVAARGAPPDGESIVHDWADELLLQQNSVCDGQTTSRVRERAERSPSLGGFVSDVDDVRQPRQT
jgi:hypothetical protein